MKKKEFRHLSLFSGCGGMDIGIQGNFEVFSKFLGGKKTKKNSRILLPKTRFRTVFANDIKKSSHIFWNRNNLNQDNIFHRASIVDLVKKQLSGEKVFPEDIDLVTGGFPCQDFSVSGLRKGFNSHKSHLNNLEITNTEETRGRLYSWMRKVIEITKPKIFIAENVKGLLNFENVFEIIKKDFESTGNGYTVFAKELFAPDYGIPQSRRRIFFIGISNSFIADKNIVAVQEDVFPEVEFGKDGPDLISNIQNYTEARFFFDGLYEPEQEPNDLSQQRFSKAKFIKGSQGSNYVKESGFAPTIRSEHHGNIEYRYLSRENGGVHNKERRLTVRECARIQTFEDKLEFVFDERSKEGLSASTAYKLIGDAVPPLLAYKIARKIESFLIKHL